jgi:serine/threonine-protein kinase RsbW
MSQTHRLQQKIDAHTEAVSAFLAQLEAWCDAHDLHPGVAGPVGLMMDEWLTNLVMHAYRGAGGAVEIEAEAPSPDRLELLVRDWGPPFDPTHAREPDLALSLDDREPGGLGIHFMRRMATHMDYVRRGDANELRFGKAAGTKAFD